MALNKRSRLHKVLLTFDESGKYVTGEALFQEGAWDTETNDWFGEPVKGEYPITNMTPDGKKFFNDVIGVVAAKALEAAEVWKTSLTAAQNREQAIHAELVDKKMELADALGARDNFAKLHNEAKAALMSERIAHTHLKGQWDNIVLTLNKRSGWLYRLTAGFLGR